MDFPLLCCFYTKSRDKLAVEYGASGVKNDEPSFKDHMATAEGQAELRAFVQRIDARVQQDWDRLPAHLKGGALSNSHGRVCHHSGDALNMALARSTQTKLVA